MSWDKSCFQSTSLDLYLYALNSSSLLLPIHGWRSIPADKGQTSVKLAPSWWIDDAHQSSNQSMYINIVPSGNQPWDTANPTGPTWTAMYKAPAKGHNPPKDAISDPSAANKVISVFYASGGLTGAGKTAAIVCPLIVVAVAAALIIRKLHLNRNNKTADFAEKVDKRMSRISVDWARGGDGSHGATPGSRPASYVSQSRPGSMFGGGAHGASNSADYGLYNRAGLGTASGGGSDWTSANPRHSQISFAPGTHGSTYDPAVPSPLAGGLAHRSSASVSRATEGSALKQSWYPPAPGRRGYDDEDMEDLDDFAVMSAEEKRGAQPLPSAEAIALEMPGSHPLSLAPGPHDSVITPSEATNPFELDQTPGHSPMPQHDVFGEAYADTSAAPESAYDDGAMVSNGPIGQAYTATDLADDPWSAEMDDHVRPAAQQQQQQQQQQPRPSVADDPWSADMDARPVGHQPRPSEAWTPAETQSHQSDVSEFAAYQAAASAGLTEDLPAGEDSLPAGGHGRSTSVAQQQATGTAHARTASAGPRTLVGAASRPESGVSGQSGGTSFVSNEDQVVGYTEPGVYSNGYTHH